MSLYAVDSHIHVHDCFDKGLFFESCFKNMSLISQSEVKNGILFFTEGRNEDSYNYLRTIKDIKYSFSGESFHLSNVEGTEAIEVFSNKWKMKLVIFPGFQIVTKENLEVLSLATYERIPDGLTIEETISKVKSLNGIPVLPWGFGKWFGNRGRKIEELIKSKFSKFYFGDNGGRSNILPFPAQFRLAEELGIKILPGSDPLPFTDEAKRPLSYGFLINASDKANEILEDVKLNLADSRCNFQKFGNLTSPMKFVRTQIVMQLKKQRYK